ncbi:MAG: sigma 54-interacting transcriptional regulator, partial [Saprospiraceae bacterium]|nr:sigma 54-interacting transcriptional regulator [Saprospiraceae bacterium]
MLVKNYQVLLLDDQVEFHQEMRATFRKHYIFDGARTIPELEKKLEETQYDLLLLDLVLDEDSGERIGLSLIEKAKILSPGLPVIVVTKDNDAETALEAINLGATNFLYKGKFNYDTWDRKFKKAIEGAPEELPGTAPKQQDFKSGKETGTAETPHSFIGQSPKIMEIKRLLDALSEEPEITVLLTGETGVGKEVAARYLHRQGPRKDRPFQAINLTTVQKTLLESTLFGHVKGAFT